MPTFLDRLVRTAWHPETTVRPRTPSRFEPGGALEPAVTVGFAESPAVARDAQAPDAPAPESTGRPPLPAPAIEARRPGRSRAPRSRAEDRDPAGTGPRETAHAEVAPPARRSVVLDRQVERSISPARVGERTARRTEQPFRFGAPVDRSERVRRDDATAPPALDLQPARVSPPAAARATGAPSIPTSGPTVVRASVEPRDVGRVRPAARVGDAVPDLPARRGPADVADARGAAARRDAVPDLGAGEGPVIQVTIGRVEVRATVASGPEPKRPPRTPALSLDAYLRRRNGGGA